MKTKQKHSANHSFIHLIIDPKPPSNTTEKKFEANRKKEPECEKKLKRKEKSLSFDFYSRLNGKKSYNQRKGREKNKNSTDIDLNHETDQTKQNKTKTIHLELKHFLSNPETITEPTKRKIVTSFLFSLLTPLTSEIQILFCFDQNKNRYFFI